MSDRQAPPAADRGPDLDALVWLAVPRRGIDAHRPATAQAGDGPVPLTGCGRSMRTGVTMTAADAQAAHAVAWCRTCWAEPAPEMAQAAA